MLPKVKTFLNNSEFKTSSKKRIDIVGDSFTIKIGFKKYFVTSIKESGDSIEVYFTERSNNERSDLCN